VVAAHLSFKLSNAMMLTNESAARAAFQKRSMLLACHVVLCCACQLAQQCPDEWLSTFDEHRTKQEVDDSLS
jgi:hypothetical protein